MPCRFAFILVILISVLSPCQENTANSHIASLSGTVIQGNTHLPLKNVQVSATSQSNAADDDDDSGADRQFTAKTDEKGHFAFAGLAPGTYTVQASYSGMVMKNARWREGMQVALAEGKSQSVDVVLLPAGVITGRVVNEEGEAMQNVPVVALRNVYTIAGRVLAQASNGWTDDRGQYRLFGLYPGSYLLMADPERGGWNGRRENQKVYITTYYPDELFPEQATPVVLKPGDEFQADLSLSKTATHSVSGTISGLPATKSSDKDEDSRLTVTAVRRESPMPVGGLGIISRTGNVTSFKVSSVAPGKYKIAAILSSDGENARSSGYKEITVGSSDVTGVNIVMGQALNQMTGVIHAEGDQKPDYSKFFVSLMPVGDTDEPDTELIEWSAYASGGTFAEVKRDGSFKTDLSHTVKSYRVLVNASGAGLEDWYPSKAMIGEREVLNSGFNPLDAQHATIDITVSNKGASVEGTIADGEKKPRSNAQVILLPADSKLRRRFDLFHTATADQLGHFKLHGIRPGEYFVFAVDDPQAQPFATAAFLKTNSKKIQTVKLEAAEKQELQLEMISGPAE